MQTRSFSGPLNIKNFDRVFKSTVEFISSCIKRYTMRRNLTLSVVDDSV